MKLEFNPYIDFNSDALKDEQWYIYGEFCGDIVYLSSRRKERVSDRLLIHGPLYGRDIESYIDAYFKKSLIRSVNIQVSDIVFDIVLKLNGMPLTRCTTRLNCTVVTKISCDPRSLKTNIAYTVQETGEALKLNIVKPDTLGVNV